MLEMNSSLRHSPTPLSDASLELIEEEDSDDSYYDMRQICNFNRDPLRSSPPVGYQPNCATSDTTTLRKLPLNKKVSVDVASPLKLPTISVTYQESSLPTYDSLAPATLPHRAKSLPQDYSCSTQPTPYSVFEGSSMSQDQFYEELDNLRGAPPKEESPPPPPKRSNPLSPLGKYNGLCNIPPSASMPAMLSNTNWNSAQRHGSSPLESSMAPFEEYVPQSQEMSLGELVDQHKNEFPVRARVSRGFYGTTDKWSISEGEHFNIHFVKYTKVIGAIDSSFGNYTIPLNSSVEFSVLYNPHGSIDAAVSGYDFKTAAELIALDNRPLAVKVTVSWHKGKSQENSVQKGDILIINGVKGKKKFLKCTHATSGQRKLLPSNCVGHFTSKPYELRLFLPEIIKYFEFPLLFVMFITSEHNTDLPDDMFSHCVKLTHCSIETSLIATQLDSRIAEETSTLIEIPIDLDIGVELVMPREEEVAQLYEETGKLFANLDISMIQTIPSNTASLLIDPTAAEAVTACHQGRQNYGVEIQQPPRYAAQNRSNASHESGGKKSQVKDTNLKFEEKFAGMEGSIQRLDSTMRQFVEQLEGMAVPC